MLLNKVSKTSEYDPYNDFLKGDKVKNIVNPLIERVKTDSSTSWRALLSKLWKVHKTKIFDQEAGQIDYDKLLEPGNVTIIDLNDTASTLINNLVISSILRKLQLKKNELYEKEVSEKKKPSTAMIIIEEAHEFLSKDKISKMQNLFQQPARIAKRGRKRRLGLTFVTQLPQHLPDDILGLLNSYIIHKIGDSNVIGRLKRSIGGVDDSLWNRVTSLPPGQAVVSSPSFRRPVLVTINPTTCKLLLND